MKVLITGSSGFLGRYTTKQFQKAGHTVFCMVRNHTGAKNEIVCDLSTATRNQLSKLIPKVDIVVHLASEVDFSETLSSRLFRVNTIATSHISHITELMQAKLIFASGMFVHGRQKEQINSQTPEAPDLPYSMSKWIAEQLILSTILNVAILRIGGIFGCNGPTHLGINKAISQALISQIPPQVFGNGNAKRNYIYVKDLARWIQFIAEKDLKGIYYLAGQEVLSIRDMANLIGQTLLGGKEPTQIEGQDPSDQIVKISSLRPELLSFERALEDIKAEYLQTIEG